MNQPGPSSSDEARFPLPGISLFLRDQVELRCMVEVAGERVEVRKVYAAEAYDDPRAREVIEKHMRSELVHAILEKWKPKIDVHR